MRSLPTLPLLGAGLLLGVGMSVLASWPLLLVSNTHFPSDPAMPDLQTAIWLPDNTLWQLLHLRSPAQAPTVNYPHGQSLLTVIWNFAVLVLQAPFYAATHAVQAYNLSLLLLSALNGLGGYVLGTTIGQRRSAGVLSAAALIFSPYVWSELSQGRCEQGLLLWLALALAGAVALWRAPTRRSGGLAGLAWGAAGIFYWFYGYFLLLFFLVLGAVALAQRARQRVSALLTAAAVSALCAAPLALPILAAVVRPGSRYHRALSDDAPAAHSSFSIGVLDLFWWASPPRELFAMLPLTLVVGLVGCALRRESRALLGLGLVGLVLSLGPILQWTSGQPVTIGDGGTTLTMPMAAFQAWVPGFARLWWSYRLIALTVVSAAAGLAALVARAGRRGPALAAVLAVVLLAEHRLALSVSQSRLLWDNPAPLQVPTFFQDLAEAPGELPVFMLPYRGWRWSGLLWQPYHRQPVSSADGYSEDFTFSPEQLAAIQASPARVFLQSVARRPLNNAPPAAQPFAAELRADGYRYAVLQLGPSVRAAHYHALFARLPIYEDAVIVVWDLDAEP